MKLREVLEKQTIFAFNCDDFVIYKGVVRAVEEMDVSAILQISSGEMDFWGLERFTALVKSEKPSIFLNFDHARDISTAKKVIDLGFDMIHLDGSLLPWEENIRLTREVVEMAHAKDILVEGEPESENTDPRKVLEFADQTEVDLIAVFVGNKHGFNPKVSEKLDINRLQAIKKSAGDGKYLTLHGGSGVDKNDLKVAIGKRLIAKININTELRFAYRQALNEAMATYCGEKIYELVNPVAEAVKKAVIEILKY